MVEVFVTPVQGRVLQGDTPEEMSDEFAKMILDITARFSQDLNIDGRIIASSVVYSIIHTLWWGGEQKFAKDLAEDMIRAVVDFEEDAKEQRH